MPKKKFLPIKSNKKVFFSIAAPNYVGIVAVLANSLLEKIENSFFYVVVIEDCPNSKFKENLLTQISSKRKSDSVSILNLSDINWPREFDPYFAANKYDLLEFCTAIKPSIFLHLFQAGHERITYLDPDIKVFSDFTALVEEESAIALTPHIFTPYPVDGCVPSALTILNAGLYNLGFISAGIKSIEFMKWWALTLADNCYMQIQDGMHVDQKWVDLAPFFADVQVIQNKGMNVAYWNLHERKIKYRKGQFLVSFGGKETSALYFFHFSGFTPNKFGSKHSTRVLLTSSDLYLKMLFRRYKNEVKFSNDTSYSWFFANRRFGIPLSDSDRSALQLISKNSRHSLRFFYGRANLRNKDCCPICNGPLHKFPARVKLNQNAISKFIND